MRFRPCIDLKNGKVVQIVGGTLSDSDADSVATNFTSERQSSEFAKMYAKDDLAGGHVIALGPGNHDAAVEALGAYQGGLQYGGGVTCENAPEFLDAGASHVIVTSYVFREGKVDLDRLNALRGNVGRERLVLDLSCRMRDGSYWVVTDRWQNFTETRVDEASLSQLSKYCSEFLIHGVDVEGKMNGVETELVSLLGRHSSIPVTYAGGARSLGDLDAVREMGADRVDLTIGSALDIFGGTVSYEAVVAWHKSNS